jgi:hypothetical protein
MARRWEERHDKPLSKQQLDEFRNTLLDKDHFGLEKEYTSAHYAARLVRGVPAASYIQRLVTVWKVMRRRAGIRSQ